jgi:hypothetical protein
MMKNKVQIIGAGLLALILVFAGCSNPLGERPDASPEAVSGGKIVVTLGGLDARTLGPMADDVAGLKYRLVLQGIGGNGKFIEKDIEDFTQPVEYSVEVGNWKVGVFAYTGDNKTAWGESANVQVLEGETKAVSITLLPVTDQDAAGIFDYDIDFPEPTDDFGYASATLKLSPSGGSSPNSGTVSINLLDPGKNAGTLNLPAGRYTLDITLTSMRQIYSQALKVTVKETVYLYPGLTTKAPYEFSEAQFAADVYLKGTASVNNHTERDANGKPLVNYIPTKVQIKLYDDPSGDPDDANTQDADITLNEETDKYEWELVVSSEKINGSDNASQVKLRFVIADEKAPAQMLTSALQPVDLSDKQGNKGVFLSTDVYSIVPSNMGISGVRGIAHNKHAIAGTPVELKIVPPASYGGKYGVRGNYISVSSAYNYTLAPDGTVGFTMQDTGDATVSVNATYGYFHLAGTILSIPTDYKVNRVEAWGDKKNEETGAYDWGPINGTSTLTGTNNEWTIPDIGNYVYTGVSNNIRFKVLMTKTDGSSPTDFTYLYPVSSLTGTDEVALYPTLYTVSNLHQTGAATNSVTLSWDAASWATGFNIYRNGTKITATPLAAGTTSYTNDTGLTAGTNYQYTITGFYGTPPTEGSQSQPVSAKTKLAAPQSVNVSIAAESYSPFRTQITWNTVTGVSYYEVYRDGTLVNTYDVYDTSYDDNEYKTPGQVYTYKVVAKGSSGSYDITSADSAPATGSFPAPSTNQSGYIGSSGVYNYHRFTASDSGYYYLSFSSGSFDAYAYVYVNGSQYSSFYNGGSVGLNANAGDEMIVAVRANDFSSTGSYYININSW